MPKFKPPTKLNNEHYQKCIISNRLRLSLVDVGEIIFQQDLVETMGEEVEDGGAGKRGGCRNFTCRWSTPARCEEKEGQGEEKGGAWCDGGRSYGGGVLAVRAGRDKGVSWERERRMNKNMLLYLFIVCENNLSLPFICNTKETFTLPEK